MKTDEIRRETVVGGNVRGSCLMAGSGKEAVFMLHGLGASCYSFRHMWAYLDGYRVYAPDWPGFGRSEKPWDFDYSVKGFATWLRDVMDSLGIEKAHLIGNSMGGISAVGMARYFPERVGKLVLLGTPAYLEDKPPLLWPLRWPVIGRLYEACLGAWLIPIVARTVFVDKSLVTPEMVEEYAFGLREPGGTHSAAQFIRNAVPPDVEEILAWYPSLPSETLVIVGTHDGVVDPKNAEKFSKVIPHGTFLKVEQCGHAPHEEKPDIVGGAIREFLNAS